MVSISEDYEAIAYASHLSAGRKSFKEILPRITNGKFTPEPKPNDEPETPKRVGLPKFIGADKTNFDTLSKYLAILISQHSDNTNNVILENLTPQIFTCSAAVENLQGELNNTKEALTRSIKVANEASEAKIKALEDTIASQYETHNQKLQLLIPGDVVNLENFQKDLKANISSGFTSSEAKLELKIREGFSDQSRTLKNTMSKKPVKPGNGSGVVGSSQWANDKINQDKAQETEEPKMITVPRQVVTKRNDGTYEHGYENFTVKERKFRNRNNQIKSEEMLAKEEKRAQSDADRAAREILIFGLPTPEIPDKPREIRNVMTLMEELKTIHIGDKGVKIKKNDLVGLQCERIWNWGGVDYKGEKPLKVLFNKKPIVDKIKDASRAAGFWFKRKHVTIGMFKDSENDLPDSFIRGSTTLEQRLKFKEREKKRKEHELTVEYQRYKVVQDHKKGGDRDGDEDEGDDGVVEVEGDDTPRTSKRKRVNSPKNTNIQNKPLEVQVTPNNKS